MDSKTFELLFDDALGDINHARLFESERGYQGDLLGELKQRLKKADLPDGWLLEQEHQKRFKDHGLTIRPDIILHIPFNAAVHAKRIENNFVVIQLKPNASKAEALKDFSDLDKMIDTLKYPLGIFLNVNSNETWSNLYNGQFPEKLRFYAVSLNGKNVTVHKSFAPNFPK